MDEELIKSILARNVPRINELIDSGADVNYVTAQGATPLLYAILKGFTEIVELLIDKGADVNYADRVGKTPLIVAVNKGYKGIVELLIDRGADVNYENSLGGELKIGERMIKAKYTPLLLAVVSNNIEIVKLLIEKGADVRHKIIQSSRAYSYNNDGNPIITEIYNGRNTSYLLEFAIMKGNVEMVKLLIDEGADVKDMNIYARTMGYKEDTNIYKIVRDAVTKREKLIRRALANRMYELKTVKANKAAKNRFNNYINLVNTENAKRVRSTRKNTPTHTIYIVPRTDKGVTLTTSAVNESNIIVPQYNFEEHFNTLVKNYDTYKLCTNLGGDYVEKSLNACDFFIYANAGEELLGFVIVNIHDPTKLYISVLCSNPAYKGIGTKLINYVKSIAKNNEFGQISLNSVIEASSFYNKQGFVKNSNVMKYRLVPMTYTVVGGRRRKTRKVRKY